MVRKAGLRLSLGVLISLACLGLFNCSAARHQGKPSTHFDGERFFNPNTDKHSFADFLRWMWNREPSPWPDNPPVEPKQPDPPVAISEGVRVTLINHATFLIQLPGVNILTDPIWSERASPVGFAGPVRKALPGLRFEQLPPIDLVLVSHNHYDHMDLPTLERLALRDQPRVVVPLGNRVLLDGIGLEQIQELDWWQSLSLPAGLTLTLVPALHFSSRTPFDRDRSLWGGFYLQQQRQRIYFAGDTGSGAHFSAIRERLGSPTLALLPIGAYKPRWFMGPVHLSPQDAVEAHLQLGAITTIPMHYGTFQLADDGFNDPLTELQAALHSQHADFHLLSFGESYRQIPTALVRMEAVESESERTAGGS